MPMVLFMPLYRPVRSYKPWLVPFSRACRTSSTSKPADMTAARTGYTSLGVSSVLMSVKTHVHLSAHLSVTFSVVCKMLPRKEPDEKGSSRMR